MASVLALFLTACDFDIGDDIDRTAPSISVTSHIFGQTITGNNTVTVTGTVSADTQTITATLNDMDVAGLTHTGTDFSMDLTLANGSNSIFIQAKDGTNNSHSITFILFYAYANISTGQDASLVMGQANFDTNLANRGTPTTAGANTLANVTGGMIERNNTVLYVTDTGNHRILRFDTIPTVSDASASLVYGQQDFATVGLSSSVDGKTFASPNGIYADDEMMLVADTGRNRVLIWNSLPADAKVEADLVLGQANLMEQTPGCSASMLDGPASVFRINDTIVVADSNNNRILIWNTLPVSSGEAADLVLGQQNMVFCAPNDIDGDGATDANPEAFTLSGLGGIWTDGVRLLAADTGNNRVLVWNTFPTANAQGADFVLGQASMTTASQGLTQSTLNAPLSVSSNGNQIAVADTGNNRAMVWNTFPTANQAAADIVIGQDDFTQNATGISINRMTSYDNIFLDRGRLFVVDGNRIMVFTNP